MGRIRGHDWFGKPFRGCTETPLPAMPRSSERPSQPRHHGPRPAVDTSIRQRRYLCYAGTVVADNQISRAVGLHFISVVSFRNSIAALLPASDHWSRGTTRPWPPPCSAVACVVGNRSTPQGCRGIYHKNDQQSHLFIRLTTARYRNCCHRTAQLSGSDFPIVPATARYTNRYSADKIDAGQPRYAW